MMFWIVAICLTLAVAFMVLAPLLRGTRAEQASVSDVAVYTAQLAEIDRDIARGVLEAAEGERARTEVARRLLAADARGVAASGDGKAPVVAAVTGILTIAVALATYAWIGAPGQPDQPLSLRLAQADEMRANRPDQAALEAVAGVALPPVEATDAYLESVAELRAIMPTRPDDLQGWELLAFHEAELRDFPAAARAQARVVTLKADDVTTLDLQRKLDLMVLATNGIVSPQAEDVIRQILDREDRNIAARYHLGALYDQTGRSDLAFPLWRPIAESTTDGYHINLARLQIENVAARAGIRYTLPDRPGPSAADVAAAQDMSDEDRTAMIEGMVAGLADRLANDGGTAQDWARLIGAYGVLGRTDDAQLIFDEAQTAFAADPDGLQLITDAARNAGLTE